MANIKFRAARIRDLDAVVSLMKEYYRHDHIPWNRNIRPGLAVLLTSRRLGQVFLIELADKTAGYAILTYGFDLEFGGLQGLVTDLYVRPQFRRLGLGTRAIQFLSAVCKEQKIKVLELQVERRNKQAQMFYKKLGFAAHNRLPLSKWISK